MPRHEHSAREDWLLADPETYGEHAGHRYTVRYDADGVRIDAARRVDGGQGAVLLLGDSFVEGYDDANTLSAHVARVLAESGRARAVLNAGASSYSPLIYTVQAKRLIPVWAPAWVVVVLDETDLGDDWLRYRSLAVRNLQGDLVAVRSSPAHRAYAAGFLALKNDPPFLYLERLLRRVALARWSAATAAGRTALNAIDPLVFARDTAADAAARHAEPLAALRRNVDELVQTLIALHRDRRRILLVVHPHLQHLQPDADGRSWNRFVATVAKDVAARHGVGFFDALPPLREEFGDAPERYYWNGDMHFRFRGLRAYGEILGEEMAERMSRLE